MDPDWKTGKATNPLPHRDVPWVTYSCDLPPRVRSRTGCMADLQSGSPGRSGCKPIVHPLL